MKLFQEIYELVKKIPVGEVRTYGDIARDLPHYTKASRGIGFAVSPQLVGWALHANKSCEVPCHRVVNKDGRLAPNFAFDGAEEQRRRLLAEGVEFIDEIHVKLC
jgi:methylated-DNA-protein-cysteine methyltransferase related protein